MHRGNVLENSFEHTTFRGERETMAVCEGREIGGEEKSDSFGDSEMFLRV